MDQQSQTGPVAGTEAPSTPTEQTSPTPAPAAAQAPKKAKKPAPKGKAVKAKKPSGKSGSTKGVSGPAVLKQYAPEYVKGGKKGDSKTVAGNKTIDNGDKLADKLRGLSLDETYKLAAETLNAAAGEGDEKVTQVGLKKQYQHLNVGMQRMNLGNRMRGALGLSKGGKKA